MDEKTVIDSFNALSEAERAFWLNEAGSSVPADAWAAYRNYLDDLNNNVFPY